MKIKEKESYKVCDCIVKNEGHLPYEKQELRAELILRYLPLVRGIARRCGVLGRADTVDIIQEGVLGLIQAVDRFDPCRGVQVSSFAYWWIRKAILTAAYSQDPEIQGLSEDSYKDTASTSNGRDERSYFLDKVGGSFQSDQGSANAVESVRTDFNSSNSRDFHRNDWYRKRLLLRKSVCHGLLTEVERWRFEEDEIDIRISIMDALSTLTDLERSIICLRYGLDRDAQVASVSEISWATGLSREQIRRLEESALYKLRNVSGQFGLRVLLDE